MGQALDVRLPGAPPRVSRGQTRVSQGCVLTCGPLPGPSGWLAEPIPSSYRPRSVFFLMNEVGGAAASGFGHTAASMSPFTAWPVGEADYSAMRETRSLQVTALHLCCVGAKDYPTTVSPPATLGEDLGVLSTTWPLEGHFPGMFL